MKHKPSKQFFVQDRSGRGYSVTLEGSRLLEWDDETDWNDKGLHDFVSDADVGDTWNSASTKITRTK